MMSLRANALRVFSRMAYQRRHSSFRVASNQLSHHVMPLLLQSPPCHDCTTTRQFATANKKKKRDSVASAREGRIVSIEESKVKGARLCVGCGAQVTRGGNDAVGMIGGEEAVDDSGLSKKEQKKMRYLDVTDANSNFLCNRCKALKSENLWNAYDALYDVAPSVFSKQLSFIVRRRQFGLCVLVVDSTDPEHTAMKRLRKSIGNIPCILVFTKADLVPRMSRGDQNQLRRRIQSITGGTQFIDCFAVSAVTGQGIFNLAEGLLEKLQGRDVFVVGCANVGKSTLVQKLASTIADAVYMKGKRGKRRRDLASNLNVTGSHLPGTTLQAVRIPCFSTPGHALWDTPGIINARAIQYNLFPAHLMEPLARPEAIPIPSRDNELQGDLRAGDTLLIEADWMEEQENEEPCVLARLDVVEVEGKRRSIYTRSFLHPSLRVRLVPTEEAPDHATIPPSYIQQIKKRMKNTKLQDEYSLPLKPFVTKELPEGRVKPHEREWNDNAGRYFVDISFASLGFISIAHEASFTLIPHCVEGSVFSKRRSIYPLTLEHYEHDEEYDDTSELNEDEMRRRLQDAARRGRHQQEKMYHGSGGGDYYDDDDFEDEWY